MWYDDSWNVQKESETSNKPDGTDKPNDIENGNQATDQSHHTEIKPENRVVPKEELPEPQIFPEDALQSEEYFWPADPANPADPADLADNVTHCNSVDMVDATLEELLAAELSSSTSEKPDAHLAILAAFENSLKVETVAQDVSDVCEEIKDLTQEKPIPMPECTKWQDVEPVSRFGLGGTVDNSGKGGSNIFVSGFILAHPIFLTSSVLASLMIAGFAYSGPVSVLNFITDFIPLSSERAKVIESANTGNDATELAQVYTANAGGSGLQNAAPIVVGKPVFAKTTGGSAVQEKLKSDERLMSSSSTHQEGGVTVVEKMPDRIVEPEILANNAEPVEKIQDFPIPKVSTSAEPIRIAGKTLVSSDNKPGSVGSLDDGMKNQGSIEGLLKNSTVEKRLAALSPNNVIVQPRPVKTVSIIPKILDPAKKRSKESVELAMLHAKAVYSLSEDQKRRLVPKLVNGACVAISLQEVAGRVSPVLMRDLLAHLNSDC